MGFDLSYLMALIAIGALPAMAMASDQDDALAQRDIQTGAVLEGAVPVAKRSLINMAGYSNFLAKHGPHGSETGRKPKVSARSPAPIKGRLGDLQIPPNKGFSGRGTPKTPGKPKPVTKRPPPLEIPGRKEAPKYQAKRSAPIRVPPKKGDSPRDGTGAKKPTVSARSPLRVPGKQPPRGNADAESPAALLQGHP